MRVEVPDPEYTASRRSGQNFLLALKVAFGFLVVIWAVFLFDQLLELRLIRFGLRPRDTQGLLGLITTPLLHFNLAHISSNSFPLLVGGTIMLFLYPNSALRALPAIFFGSSLLAWLFARDSIHIGASGLIYGVLAFVFVSGVIRRDMRSIGAALMVWFLYGSMIWGVLPAGQGMSWELHFSGFVLGVVTALVFKRWDRPPMKRYEWEDDDDRLDEIYGEDQPWRAGSRPRQGRSEWQ
ncbi:MAG: rhomboid family intramembrane serine protease [Wenzhouxiangellaceae bacterium]|nr:rhomboid family intramembrane serine protease [Wenzhouxiangellaceae bacterium]